MPSLVEPALLAACTALPDDEILELKRRMDRLDAKRQKAPTDTDEQTRAPSRLGAGTSAEARGSAGGLASQAGGARRGLSVAAAAARRKAEARKKAEEQQQNLTDEELFRQQQKDLLRGMVVGSKKNTAAKIDYDDPAAQKVEETPDQRVARLKAEAGERRKEEVRLFPACAVCGDPQHQLVFLRQCASGKKTAWPRVQLNRAQS